MYHDILRNQPAKKRGGSSWGHAGVQSQASPDFSGEASPLVEAAGQLPHLFRDGLDYAFILHRFRVAGCGACYPNLAVQILVPALP